jgi:hypothetical protein
MWRTGRAAGAVAGVVIAIGTGGCGGDDSAARDADDRAALTTSTAAREQVGVAPAALRGRWVGTAGVDTVTLAIFDGGYQIFVKGGGGGFRADAEFDADTVRFVTTADQCDLPGEYHWEIDGETLTLTPIAGDPCANRKFFLGGGRFVRLADTSTTTAP